MEEAEEGLELELDWLFELSTEPSIWMTQVFLVVAATVAVNFTLMRVFDLLVHRAPKQRLWYNLVLDTARVPLRLLVWVVGLSVAIEVMQKVAPTALFELAPEFRRVAVIFILALFANRFISRAENIWRDPSVMASPVDETTASAIGKLLRLTVMVTALLVILQTLGFGISGVLAAGGVGGIAIGFAARDLLANFFGGLLVYWDQPFRVGDWVRSPDREIEGTVEEIGWRLTRIRTFDRRPLYVPNSVFPNITVENPSRMQFRRIFETVGIRYEDWRQMESICDDVREMLMNHEDIATDEIMIVNFNTWGESSLQFFIYCFTKTVKWVEFHRVKHDVLLRVMRIVEGHGAEFAFPTRTLHIASEEGVDGAPGVLPGGGPR